MLIFLPETPERSGQNPSRTYLFRWSACTLEDRRSKWGSFFFDPRCFGIESRAERP